MGKHTAGPWLFIDATKVAGMQFAPKCVIKAGNKQIASFSWNDNSPWFPTKEESQANARLIAAAPELLSALQELFDSYKSLADSGDAGKWKVEDLHEGQKALAAIAKATGESHG